MFHKAKPFKSCLCSKPIDISPDWDGLSTSHILLCQIPWKHRFRRERKLSLIFKDALQGLHFSPKMHPGGDVLALTSLRHPSGHSTPLSWGCCWKYGQTVNCLTLIFSFSKPSLAHYSPTRCYHPAPFSATLWSECRPVSAGHYLMEDFDLFFFFYFLFCKNRSHLHLALSYTVIYS